MISEKTAGCEKVGGRGRKFPSHNHEVCQLGAAHADGRSIERLFGERRLYSRNHLLSASAARISPLQSRGIGLSLNTLATLVDPVNPVDPVSRRLARKQSRPSYAAVCRGRKPTPFNTGAAHYSRPASPPTPSKVRRGESHRQNRGPNFQIFALVLTYSPPARHDSDAVDPGPQSSVARAKGTESDPRFLPLRSSSMAL